MTKTEVVRGIPLYKYKKCLVKVPPKGTFVSKMLYDKEKNVTYIYLKKHGYLTEIICSVIIALLVVVRLTGVNSISSFYYDNTPLYNNGVLYLNLKNGSNSLYDVTVSLLTYENKMIKQKKLEPNDEWLTFNLKDVDSEYILKLELENILGEVETRYVTINPVTE